MRDRPWIIRTYAGHSTAKESNELYRKNLAKGQTGLLKHGHSAIGEADDATEALNLMDEAMRRFPTSHIRIRRGITIVSERVPPQTRP
jgi:methylmalonyl-CoA mutase N-terminal domain/subunit